MLILNTLQLLRLIILTVSHADILLLSGIRLLNSIEILPIAIAHPHTRALLIMYPAHRRLDSIVTRGLGNILILADLEAPLQVLRADEGQDDDVDVHAAQEDANHLAVLVALRAVGLGGQRELAADGRLDGGRGGRDKIAKLIGGAHDEGAEGARAELHEVDGDDAPRALDAELLEEGGGNDGVRRGECVGV